MDVLMKAPIIFCVLLVLSLNTTLIFAQAPDSFFPHHVGDAWQYTLNNTNIIYQTDIIISDSTDSAGTVYLKYEGDNFYRYYIDSSYNVYGSPGGHIYNYYYKLNADSGESWDFDGQVIAKVVDVYDDIFWEINSTVKEIEYWLIIPGDSIWLATRFLASGFGLVGFWGEPGPFYHLTGTIIDSVEYGFILGIDERQHNPIPSEAIMLKQNYPNPFNPTTTIYYQLKHRATVVLEIFNNLGQKVTTLVNESQPPGYYQMQFNGSNLPSGIYYYRIETAGLSQQKKMLVIK